MTEDQLVLLRDKYVLWDRNSREGPVDLRDYNRRAALALGALLSEREDLLTLNDRLSTLPQPQKGPTREEIEEVIGKHLGPHLAISPTPRHEAIVRETARALVALLASPQRTGDGS